MNKVELTGRLKKKPEVRYGGTDNSVAIAKYTLAVDRRYKRDGEPTADFIQCVCFGKAAEFAEKYFRKGTKIAIIGRIKTGSYESEGRRIYTTDIIVEEQEFCESKKSGDQVQAQAAEADGFMNIPDSLDDDNLPFS